jgi:acetylornithine deacetylase/succinyl-diaminopimelate desuccinylase-like protein
MSKETVVQNARDFFDEGHFLIGLNKLIGIQTESQDPEKTPLLYEYLEAFIPQIIEPMGFSHKVFDNPVQGGPPFLIAERFEDANQATVLIYGHGDVVFGMEGKWQNEMDPWAVTEKGDRWYGRGTADNKGQHWIALTALSCLLKSQGTLGFNVKLLIEMGEEVGSPGLREFCEQKSDLLESDVLLASDGPRLRADRASLFMGSRGALNFYLKAKYRDGGVHSGNWGGVVKDPGIRIAQAISTITDANGKLLVKGWQPAPIPDVIREALNNCPVGGPEEGVVVDLEWGEPDLTPAERLYGCNSFAVLTLSCGNPFKPVNAIHGEANAMCQLRFIVGYEPTEMLGQLRRHLDKRGFQDIEIEQEGSELFKATRMDPTHPWVNFVAESIQDSIGQAPVRLPNLGGTIPNDAFSDVLGLPTVWVPHSYPGCSQHAPNEHALKPVLREGLEMMTGLYWDIGFSGKNIPT